MAFVVGRIAGAIGVIAVLASSLTAETRSQAFDVEFESGKIAHFRIGYPEIKKFGRLEYFGGIEITSTNRHFGALSGLSLIEDRTRIVAVADTGYWLTATIIRDEKGRPVGFAKGRMAAMIGADGKQFGHKWNADAESIAISKGFAFVSFERENRVERYRLDIENFASLPQRIKQGIPNRELRNNKGLESFAISPTNSLLKGGSIVISERSIDKDGNIFGAINDGPKPGVFTVRRKDQFDITDAEFLPNGDLLILERKFRIAEGVAMRIRHIQAESINAGTVLDGDVWIEVNMAFQIDNMEGLSVTTDGDGTTYLSLISDDNHSIFQRTLYLEFKVVK